MGGVEEEAIPMEEGGVSDAGVAVGLRTGLGLKLGAKEGAAERAVEEGREGRSGF